MNVALSEVAAINPRLRATLRDEDTVHFLGMADVSEFGSTSEGDARPYGKVRKGYTPFEDGDLLVAKITPCFENGKIAQARLGSHIGFGSTEFHVVRVDDRVADARYILHLLRSPEVRLAGESQMTGSAGQKRVPKTFLEQLKIPLPPLPEQRRIAAILDQVDALRWKRQHAIDLLDDLIDAKMTGLLADHSSATPLGKLAAVQGGLTVNRMREALPVSSPYLRVANVFRGSIDLTEVKIIGVSESELARVALQPGDILLVEGHGNPNEVGRAAMWSGYRQQMVHQNHLIRARFNERIRPRYGEAYLNSSLARRYFRSVVKTTSGLNTLNMSNVRATPVVVAPMAEQLAFEELAIRVDQQKLAFRADLRELDTLFASLQHRAFRGEL